MLANTEMKVLPAPALSLEISGASKRQGGLVRWPEISRATKQPRDVLCEHIQYLARSVPPGNTLFIGRKDREITVPYGWEVPPLHQLDFVCQLGIPGSIRFEQFHPLAPQTRASCANAGREMLIDPVRNKKFGILRPSVAAFREPDLFVAERLTVSCCGVLLVRGTVPDMAVQNDERRTALRLSEDLQRLLNALTIVCVADPQDVPAIGQEASRNILGECQARTPFDRDVVVVVDPAEIVEAEMTGQ